MLYQIFHKAEANDLVRKNPVRFADKMRSRDPVKRKEAFTAEEVRLLMLNLPQDRIGWSIRLRLGTGALPGDSGTGTAADCGGRLCNSNPPGNQHDQGHTYCRTTKIAGQLP